jgi:hypothetical protein
MADILPIDPHRFIGQGATAPDELHVWLIGVEVGAGQPSEVDTQILLNGLHTTPRKIQYGKARLGLHGR